MVKAVMALGLALLLLLGGCNSLLTTPPAPAQMPTPTLSLDEVVRQAWQRQEGSGMFFGTGPDTASPTLNVVGLGMQFSDGVPLWMKYMTPGTFGSMYVTFRIEKIQFAPSGGILSEQTVKEFQVAVNPANDTLRLQMPQFSVGPGYYMVLAYTDGKQRFGRTMRYLGPGEQPDPNFHGGY